MPANNRLATQPSGEPQWIGGIGMIIPGSSSPISGTEWRFTALPEVGVSKEATYSDIPIIGRSSPIATYAHSNYRRFQITFHLHSLSPQLARHNAQFIRALDSLTHPEYNNTYAPPRVAYFRCGVLIAGFSASGGAGSHVRIVVDSVNYTLDPEVVWLDDISLMPQYIALQANVRVVYSFNALPGADDVLGGRY